MASTSSSSSSESSTRPESSAQQQQQQQQRARTPPFANWPTIKILTPPQGRFSPKTDEWCFTMCSQSINGRVHGKDPECRSICIRRVFAHEVRNVINFKEHKNIGPDGKARYPLPAEGQAANLPRILGGPPKEEDSEDGPSAPVSLPTKHWDEGYYFWTGKGHWTMLNKTLSMTMDLRQQQNSQTKQARRREIWQDYQQHLKQGGGQQVGERDPASDKWWGPIVPPKPIPDTSSLSLLVSLPPEMPSLLDKVKKFLGPANKALDILHESIVSGEQRQFAFRVWEKAKTPEPFVLAQRTLAHAYEQFKKPDETEDEKKKST